jgi:hypothetical protein
MFGWFKRRKEAKEALKQIAKPSFNNVKRTPTRPATFSETSRRSSDYDTSNDTLFAAVAMSSFDSSSSSYDSTPSYSGGGGSFGGGGSSGSWDSGSSSSSSYDSSSSSSYDSSSSSSSFD